MKIGLIGNMNNNNFSLMRYFRDLGADAHLLLYSNDGQGSLSHFKPEADTWEIDKWRPYIHQTNIPNAPIAALEPPLSWVVSFRSRIRAKMGVQNDLVPHVTKEQLIKTYNNFEYLISSGITPATLSRIDRKVDIFYPYAIEVEFLYSTGYLKKFENANILERRILEIIQRKQAKGIKSVKKVINFDMGVTEQALKKTGVISTRLAIPMVYTAENIPDKPPNETLFKAARIISASKLSILHHARLMWKNNDPLKSKNTHWLIKSYSKLIKMRPDSNPQLFIVEYGPDISVTKELVDQLGISSHVTWLPKMKRKHIIWLLSRVSAGIGEFYDIPKMIWGGTGWEVLASGKPLIQGFNFKEGEFEHLCGYPPPPILPVSNKDDILKHLLYLADSPTQAAEIGDQAKHWFDKYNGAGLAKKWLECLA